MRNKITSRQKLYIIVKINFIMIDFCIFKIKNYKLISILENKL